METANTLTALELLEIEEIERIAAERQEDSEEVNQRYTITNLSSLNWAFRKISVLDKKIKEVEDLAKEEKARIDAWKDKQLKAFASDKGFFEYLVAEWAEQARAADPKFKKESTPFGEVAFKKQQPEWTYPNESAVVEWCEAHDLETLVKTEKSVADKTQFKKAFDIKTNVIVKDGEVIDTVDKDGNGLLYQIHVYGEEDGGGFAIIDKEAGEIVKDAIFMETAVVERMSELVVPGVKAEYRPDKLEVKAAK